MSQTLNEYILVQYADDTQIILSGKVQDLEDLVERAEKALIDAKTYFLVNGLNINEQKTQCIFIGSRQLIAKIPSETRIYFGETPLIPSSTVKNLGIFMDPYMLFDIHINHISRKINGLLIALNRIKDRIDKKSRTIVVQSLALSVINYCLRVYGITTKEQIERVQKLQNFAARVAHGEARKYDHITPVMKELEWLRIQNKITFDICIFTYKICHNMLPNWLFSFPAIHDIVVRPTRQSSNLYIARKKTDIGTRAISIKGPKSWNAIPSTIQNQTSLISFKGKLKKYLLEI